MNKLFLATLLLIAFQGANLSAQRMAVVDTKAILDKIPDYKEAEKKLDQIAEGWQKGVRRL